MSVNGRAYFIYGTRAVTSPTRTLVTLASTAAIRPSIYDFYLGSSATPADNALLWQAQRFTSAGTNTAFVPIALDSADPAATAVAGFANGATDATYTANALLFWLALNQRATHRAILDPSRPLTSPATGSNGIGFSVVHTTFTGVTDMTAYYYE